ncbi:hypothetical protein, partial [Salmonella enterica]|uniref:hypothetical protein n=1 Tax=Salmonella enterica TaxID=28901 RepID=UPI001C71CF37
QIQFTLTAACCILLTASGIKIKCSEGAYTPRDSQYEMHHIILVVFIRMLSLMSLTITGHP